VTEFINSAREQDDVLYLCVKSLEKLAKGPCGKNPTAFLGPLEVMASVEETTVRDRAVALMAEVSRSMTTAQISSLVLPLLKRLAESEWFVPRRSACGLFVVVYTMLEASQRADVLETFNLLVADETPMVRKAVANALGGMACAKGSDPMTFIPTWKLLTEDPHVSVRYAAVSQSAMLASALGKEKAANMILAHFKELSSSRGWRSRMAAATQLGGLANALPSGSESTILQICISLIRDSEEDVVEPAISQLPSIAKACKDGNVLDQFISIIVPVLDRLVLESSDTSGKTLSPRIRRSISKSLLGVATIDPSTFGKQFSKMWEKFLTDTESKDAADIRRVTVDGLAQLTTALGDEFSTSDSSKWGKIVRTIYENSKSAAVNDFNAKHNTAPANNAPQMGDALPGEPVETPKWRMRAAFLRNISALAKKDKAYALQLWTGSLSDEANEVRLEAGTALAELCKSDSGIGGTSGVIKEYIPVLMQFWRKAKDTTSGNYHLRIIAINAACCVAPYSDVWNSVQSIVEDGFKDNVSNVRLATIRLCGKYPVAGKHFKSKLNELQKSDDIDTKSLAEKSLAMMG
jgi:3-methyladenine DNA glycosylase AlkD